MLNLPKDTRTWVTSLNLFKGLLKDLFKTLFFRNIKPRYLTANKIMKINDLDHIGNLDRFSYLNSNNPNLITPVKNQGFGSTCIAYSTISTIDILLANKNLYNESYNPDHSMEKELFNLGKSNSLFKGWNLDEALKILNDNGVYNFFLKKKVKISGYTILKNTSDMKEWLKTRGPLISIMAFKFDLLFYKEGIYHYSFGPNFGGHAVCVVGFDDNKGAWLCKNSWSKHWGIEGFFWIKYGECSIDLIMWAIEDVCFTKHKY